MLSQNNLECFSNAVCRKGAAVENIWGFVDITVQAGCCSGSNQRVLHNGHKWMYSIKYQAVSVPYGFCAYLSGSFEGGKAWCI